jgi:hypothetical protein
MKRFRGPGACGSSADTAGLLLAVLVLAIAGFGSSDASRASAATMPLAEAPRSTGDEWIILLAEDFEGDFPATTWRLTGNPTWGREAYRPHNGGWSGYCAGGGAQAVEPPGPYPDDMRAWMTYGPFDLSNAVAAELEFRYWTQLGPEEDRLFWGASRTNFGYFGNAAQGNSSGWRQIILDLDQVSTGYLGEPEVWIGFEFRSDAASSGEGAYLDDVVLRVKLGQELPYKDYVPLAVRDQGVTLMAE